MEERDWMYTGWSRTQPLSNDWIDNTNQFLDRAFSMPNLVEDGTIKCPCMVCRNCVRHTKLMVEMHLCRVGFKEDYRVWTSHGEGPANTYVEGGHGENFVETDHMDEMLATLVGDHPPPIDEQPAYAQDFYRMVENVDQLVHENTSHSSLSGMARLLAMKAQYNMSIAHFEANLELIHELLPPESKLPKDFYQSKKLFEGLGMAYVKIDVCYNNCMLYYKDNKNKDKCDVCGLSRYEEDNG